MHCAAIPTRTGGECTQQWDFSKEFQKITATYRTCFHEILACVAGETCAHEDIEHIMDMRFGLIEGQAGMGDKRPGKVFEWQQE